MKGYRKEDGRPKAGRRSKVLRVRIGTDEYASIQQASTIEGVSVSEYLRAAAADHARRTVRVFERLQQDAARTAKPASPESASAA